MRFLRRSLVGIFLLSLTFGILAWAGDTFYGALKVRWAQEDRSRPARERVFAVNVVEIEPQTITPVLTSFGEVRSRRTLDLRATANGTIIELASEFEEGGYVTEGQLLVRIDQQDAQSALDVVGADLLEAQAEQRDAARGLELALDELTAAKDQVRLREQALARQKNLATRGVGTEAAVETAELALSSAGQSVLSRRQSVANAEARVDQAATSISRININLAEAKRALAETEIYAGFAGTPAEVSIVEGGLVSRNERIAQIVDATALEVSFRVSTPQYTRLLDDQGRLIAADVLVSLDILGVDLGSRGVITRESAAVGDGQTGRLLFARLTDSQGFRPGDFVTVAIEEPSLERVAMLPSTAVDSANTVLVLDENERLESLDVDVLRRQGDDLIVAARGLVGRQIVAERSPLLGTGIRVRAITPPTGEPAAGAAPPEPDLVELSAERRARLVAFVEGNQFMPAEAKERVLGQLQKDMVPAQIVSRLESRMGG